MKVKYSATFEFTNDPPVTVKGETEAASLGSLFKNAANALKRTHPRRQWSSCVICLLERID